ncbi:MAG: SMC-Scp complex subunit ScpB [Bacteroidota bacterium]
MNEIMTTQRIELKGMIEAMIFASDEPLSLSTLKDVFEASEIDGQRIEIEMEEIKHIIEELNAEYSAEKRSYHIIEIAGGYQYATLLKFSSWVGKIFKEKARRRLSQSAMESLAIIAYKQPVTKPALEYIRGVNSDYVLKTLLERNLVAIIGRASTPGRPLIYGTTQDFLRHFGLNSLSDLPKPREIEELLGETELEVEKRILEEQQMTEEEEIETQQKPREAGPRFRKPLIPKPKEESPDQMPLPIFPGEIVEQKPEQASPVEGGPEISTLQEESTVISFNEQAGEPVPEIPEQSAENAGNVGYILEMTKEAEQIQSSTGEVLSDEEMYSEQKQESMTWEQIPEEETQGEPLHPGIAEPTFEELNAVIQEKHERGWAKLAQKIRDLLKRLFG